jgi:hypothetical protein
MKSASSRISSQRCIDMNARIFVATAAMVVVIAGSVAAQSLPYLSDTLKGPAY